MMKSIKDVKPIKVNIIEKKSFFIECPHCKKDDVFEISHLIDNKTLENFGPWYCDNCCYGICGVYSQSDNTISLTGIGTRPDHVKGLALLSLDRGNEPPLYFIIEESVDTADQSYFENLRYKIEEHTCPTNFIGVFKIIDEGDDDPHGLFKLIAWVPKPDDYNQENVNWSKIFPQINSNIFKLFKA